MSEKQYGDDEIVSSSRSDLDRVPCGRVERWVRELTLSGVVVPYLGNVASNRFGLGGGVVLVLTYAVARAVLWLRARRGAGIHSAFVVGTLIGACGLAAASLLIPRVGDARLVYGACAATATAAAVTGQQGFKMLGRAAAVGSVMACLAYGIAGLLGGHVSFGIGAVVGAILLVCGALALVFGWGALARCAGIGAGVVIGGAGVVLVSWHAALFGGALIGFGAATMCFGAACLVGRRALRDLAGIAMGAGMATAGIDSLVVSVTAVGAVLAVLGVAAVGAVAAQRVGDAAMCLAVVLIVEGVAFTGLGLAIAFPPVVRYDTLAGAALVIGGIAAIGYGLRQLRSSPHVRDTAGRLRARWVQWTTPPVAASTDIQAEDLLAAERPRR